MEHLYIILYGPEAHAVHDDARTYIYIQGDGEIKWAHNFDQVDDDL